MLLVLWTVVLLALLATQLVAAGRGQAQLALNLRAAAAVEAAADGAFAEAVFHWLDPSARRWPADGSAHTLRLPGAVAEVRVASEAGRINLNTAPVEVLAALLHQSGADSRTAATVAAAIGAWRFPAAEADAAAKLVPYRRAGRDYGPPNAAFQDVQELGLVLGMTPDLLAAVTPHLTVLHDGEPDIRLADPVIRRALAESAGALPADPGGPLDENVVEITAAAAGTDGARFVRHGVVKRGLHPEVQPFRVLTWERG